MICHDCIHNISVIAGPASNYCEKGKWDGCPLNEFLDEDCRDYESQPKGVGVKKGTGANDDKLRESLADLCHKQWSGWMEYLFSKTGVRFHDDSVVIPEEYVKRWKRQIKTDYADLPESEKESDRKEADRFLKLLKSDQQQKAHHWSDEESYIR